MYFIAAFKRMDLVLSMYTEEELSKLPQFRALLEKVGQKLNDDGRLKASVEKSQKVILFERFWRRHNTVTVLYFYSTLYSIVTVHCTLLYSTVLYCIVTVHGTVLYCVYCIQCLYCTSTVLYGTVRYRNVILYCTCIELYTVSTMYG